MSMSWEELEDQLLRIPEFRAYYNHKVVDQLPYLLHSGEDILAILETTYDNKVCIFILTLARVIVLRGSKKDPVHLEFKMTELTNAEFKQGRFFSEFTLWFGDVELKFKRSVKREVAYLEEIVGHFFSGELEAVALEDLIGEGFEVSGVGHFRRERFDNNLEGHKSSLLGKLFGRGKKKKRYGRGGIGASVDSYVSVVPQKTGLDLEEQRLNVIEGYRQLLDDGLITEDVFNRKLENLLRDD